MLDQISIGWNLRMFTIRICDGGRMGEERRKEKDYPGRQRKERIAPQRRCRFAEAIVGMDPVTRSAGFS
jgi:hypothetical protein